MGNLNTIEERSRLHYYDLCLTHKDWLRGHLKDAVDDISRRYAEGSVHDMLEIGSGMGDIVPHLPRGLRYTGLDPTVYSVEEAKRMYPERSFVVGYAEDLPFPDASFDIVFSFQTVQSFRNPRRALSEIARVTRPGGYALLIAPNLECPWGRINSTRHYSLPRKLWFVCCRFADLAMRFFGHASFRMIPETYTEHTGQYVRKDDDLKHLVSTWEVLRTLRRLGFRDVGTLTSSRRWMRFFGPLRYYRGGMYVLVQKQ